MRDIIDCHDLVWIFSSLRSEQFNQTDSLRTPCDTSPLANQKPVLCHTDQSEAVTPSPGHLIRVKVTYLAHSESHGWDTNFNFHSFIEIWIQYHIMFKIELAMSLLSSSGPSPFIENIWYRVLEPMSLSVWKSINFIPSWYWRGEKSGDKRRDRICALWLVQRPDAGFWLDERMIG